MEEMKASEYGYEAPDWLVKALAVFVLIDVLLAVIRHWALYDWSQRLDASVLLAFLIVLPAGVFWGNQRLKTRFQGSKALLPAYFMVMLACALFGR